jgi:site-specific DNA-methyltransferase (adenine-specific)
MFVRGTSLDYTLKQKKQPASESKISDNKNESRSDRVFENIVKYVAQGEIPKIIKPVFKTEDAALYVGDCLEILNRFPDNYVDLIFADPPYNLSNDGITCHAGRMVKVNKGDWDKSKGFDEDLKFHEIWISECKRKLN